MSYYAESTNPVLYKYVKPIFITEPGVCDRVDAQVYIKLTADNFNFALLESDGKDIRIAENLNGSATLCHWINHYDDARRELFIWIRIPFLGKGETKNLFVFWGREYDMGISDPDSLLFYFSDDFRKGYLDTSKWSHSGSIYFESGVGLRMSYNMSITCKASPFVNRANWIVEFGAYWDIQQATTGLGFSLGTNGTENPIRVDYYRNNKVNTDARISNSLQTYYGAGGADNSYNRHIISYYEPTDYVNIEAKDRYYDQDGIVSIERQGEGDTRLTNFWFGGFGSHGFYYVYISWVLIRQLYSADPTVDLSNLFIPNEYVPYEPLEFEEYGPDLVNVNYYHLSSAGGDPYKLSDKQVGSLNSYLEISGEATAYAVIDFGRTDVDYVGDAINLIPYVYNPDTGMWRLEEGESSAIFDAAGKRYWEGSDETGWIALEFPSPGYIVNTLSLKGEDSSHMINGFAFQGGFIAPYKALDYDWFTLVSGTCVESIEWQTFYFRNYNKFNYYRLVINSTFGGDVPWLRRWSMGYRSKSFRQKVISKIKIHPSTFEDNEKYFPKEISFYGSNNMVTWTPLFEHKKTATPYYNSSLNNRWQEFAFINNTPFWAYKLVMNNNWAGTNDKFMIDEWEMYERSYEALTEHVLDGSTNNFGSIWASPAANLNSGWMYIVNEKVNYISEGDFVISKPNTSEVIDLQDTRSN